MKKVFLSLAVIALLACGMLAWYRSRPLAPVRTLHVQGMALASMFSPNGKILAVLTTPDTDGQSSDYNLELWDVATWQRKRVLPHVQFYLAFSPDSKTLFTAYESIQQWDLTSGRLMHTYRNSGFIVGFSHDRQLMALCQSSLNKSKVSGMRITIWDTGERRAIRSITLPAAYVSYGDAVFSPNATLLAIGTGDTNGELTVWNIKTGKQVQKLQGRVRKEQQAAFSSDGKMLAVCGKQQDVTLWDTQTWQPIRTLSTDFEKVRDLGFSVSGTRFAASGDVATGKMNARGQKETLDSLKMWDVQTGNAIPRLSNQASGMFLHNSQFILTQGAGLALCNTKDGGKIVTYNNQGSPVIYMALSPDDHLMTTTGESNRVCIWPVPTQ